jgi:hypothetical protein
LLQGTTFDDICFVVLVHTQLRRIEVNGTVVRSLRYGHTKYLNCIYSLLQASLFFISFALLLNSVATHMDKSRRRSPVAGGWCAGGRPVPGGPFMLRVGDVVGGHMAMACSVPKLSTCSRLPVTDHDRPPAGAENSRTISLYFSVL